MKTVSRTKALNRMLDATTAIVSSRGRIVKDQLKTMARPSIIGASDAEIAFSKQVKKLRMHGSAKYGTLAKMRGGVGSKRSIDNRVSKARALIKAGVDRLVALARAGLPESYAAKFGV